jgi:hypothetical protein
LSVAQDVLLVCIADELFDRRMGWAERSALDDFSEHLECGKLRCAGWQSAWFVIVIGDGLRERAPKLAQLLVLILVWMRIRTEKFSVQQKSRKPAIGCK